MLNLKKNIYIDRIFILIIAVLSSNFLGFYNVVFKDIQIYFADMIAFALTVISLIYILLFGKSFLNVIRLKNSFDMLSLLLFVIGVIEIFYTLLKYDSSQSISITLKESLIFFTPTLVYFAFRSMNINKRITKEIFEIFKYVSLVCSIIAIVALLFLQFTGKNILNLEIENYSFVRNGRGHFMIGTMVVIPSIIYLWNNILKKISISNIIILVFDLIHVIFVGQTRSLIAFVLLTMLLQLFISKKTKILFKTLIVLFVIIILLFLGYQFIYGRFNTLMDDSSINIRIDAISYYWDEFINSPVFGMGLLSPSNKLYGYLVSGYQSNYYRTDVGIIGFINCAGMIGIIWFLLVCYYCIKVIRFSYNKPNWSLFVGIFIFIFISSINLFFLDLFRVVYLPLLFLIGEELAFEKSFCQNESTATLMDISL